MPITVREADLHRNRSELIDFLRVNLTPSSDDARYDWLYLQNPGGIARAWIGFNGDREQIIGVAAAFPRQIWHHGTLRHAWILGDFCVSAQYRSLGPALQLQRSSLMSLGKEEGGAICYDFPSRAMTAIYQRLGVRAAGNQVRFTKLNRVDDKVRRYVPQQSIAKGISIVGNLALRLQQAPYSASGDTQGTIHEGDFGSEFTAFDATTSGLYPMRAVRTAEYLNWRYRGRASNQYCVLVSRRGAELFGYAVLEVNRTEWVLVDLQAVDQEKIIPGLLAYIQSVLRTTKVDRLDVPVMEQSPLVNYLRRAGFHARESHPIVVVGNQGEVLSVLPDAEHWFLMHGDRES